MQNIVAKFKQLDGLDENVIPVPKQAMKVSVRRGLGACSVGRTQAPCCPAFAITYYKAQGRTFDKINVDIEIPTNFRDWPCKLAAGNPMYKHWQRDHSFHPLT